MTTALPDSSSTAIDTQASVGPDAADVARTPIAESSRIEDIDVIRGVALFGVLLMNLDGAFRVPWTPGGSPPDPDRTNRIADHILTVAVAGKAMTLFSILFGVGLAIFLERANERGPGAMLLLARRLSILLAIGLAHALLIWNGDILFSYSVSGLIALLLIRRRPAVLLTIAVAMCAVSPLVLWCWPTLLPLPGTPEAIRYYHEAVATLGQGSYAQIVAFRTKEFVHGLTSQAIGGMSYEMTAMLIGIVLWRSGVLRHIERHRRALLWITFAGIAIGGGWMLYRVIVSAMATTPPPPSPIRRLIGRPMMVLFACGYGAGLLLLLRRAGTRRFLLRIAPLGRMAFTNYLTQSIVFSTLFYGYGFGLLGKVGVVPVIFIAIGFYVLQGIFSTYWLRRFRLGPFEWVWRSLTYGAFQPMRAMAPR